MNRKSPKGIQKKQGHSLIRPLKVYHEKVNLQVFYGQIKGPSGLQGSREDPKVFYGLRGPSGLFWIKGTLRYSKAKRGLQGLLWTLEDLQAFYGHKRTSRPSKDNRWPPGPLWTKKEA